MKNYFGTDKENAQYQLSIDKKLTKSEEHFKFGQYKKQRETEEPLKKHIQPMREILLEKKLFKEKFTAQLKHLFPQMNKASQIHVTFTMYSRHEPQPKAQLFHPITNNIPLKTLSCLNKELIQKSALGTCDTFSFIEGDESSRSEGLLYFPVVTKKHPFKDYFRESVLPQGQDQNELMREVFLMKLGSRKDSNQHSKSSFLLKDFWLKKESNSPYIFKHVSVSLEEIVEEVKFHAKG